MNSIFSSLKTIISKRSAKSNLKKSESRKLHLELLEVREMLSVTPHEVEKQIVPQVTSAEFIASVETTMAPSDHRDIAILRSASHAPVREQGITLSDEPPVASVTLPDDAYSDTLESDNGMMTTSCCGGCCCCGSATVSFGMMSCTTSEGSNGILTLCRFGNTSQSLVVNITLLPRSTATRNVDFTMPDTVTFEQGWSSASFQIPTLQDTTPEWNESVWIEVASGSGYTVLNNNSQGYVCILDDDPGEISPDDPAPCVYCNTCGDGCGCGCGCGSSSQSYGLNLSSGGIGYVDHDAMIQTYSHTLGQTYVNVDMNLEEPLPEEPAIQAMFLGEPDAIPVKKRTILSFELDEFGPMIFDEPLRVFYDTSGAASNNMYRFSIPLDASSLGSGTYAWKGKFVQYYDDGSTSEKTINGTQDVLNNTPNDTSLSGVGLGWFFKDTPSLKKDGDNVQYMTKGIHDFVPQSDGSWIMRETQITDDLILRGNWAVGFTLTAKDGTIENYNTKGKMVSRIDPSGNETVYEYRSDGKLARTIRTGNLVTTYYYDEATGLLSSVIDPHGNTTTLTHDAKGQVMSLTKSDPDGDGPLPELTTFYEYDDHYRVTAVTNPNGETIRYEYDFAGRISKITAPDGTIEHLVSPMSSGMVDVSNGVGTRNNPATLIPTDNVASHRTIESKTTTTKVDRWGYPLEVTDVLGNKTTYLRNVHGQVLQMTETVVDESGNATTATTRYEYDTRNNMIREELPGNAGVRTWTYDAQTNARTKYVDEMGAVTVYEIDPVTGNTLSERRVIGEIDSLENGEQDDLVSRYFYTVVSSQPGSAPGGLLAMQVDPSGHTTCYEYNERGLVTKTFEMAGQQRITLETNTYDSFGRLLISTDAEGRVTEFRYDALGRQTKIRQGEVEAKYYYDYTGRIAVTVDPLGIARGTFVDSRGRDTESFYYVPDGEVHTSSLSSANQTTITSLTPGKRYEVFASWTSDTGNSTHVEYSFQNGSGTTITKTIDQTKTPGGHPIAGNEYRSFGSVTATGTSLTIHLNIPTSGTIRFVEIETQTTYEYDAEGEMVASTDALGNRTRYEYDALGRKTRTISPSLDPKHPEAVTETLYDVAGNVSKTIDAYGNVTEYVYNIFGNQVATIKPDPDGSGPLVSPVTRTYFDVSGRTRGQIDTAGRMTASDYDALGNRLADLLYLNPTGKTLNSNTAEKSGVWTENENGLMTPAGDGSVKLTWTLEGLRPGKQYDILTSWTPYKEYDAQGNQVALSAFDATYSVYKSGTLLSETTVDQNYLPKGDCALGAGWKSLGRFTLGSGESSLAVELTNRATPDSDIIRYVLADAIRVLESETQTVYTYDNAGRLISVSDALGNTTTYTYNSRGERIVVTQPDPDGDGPQVAPAFRYWYNNVGEQIASISPDGRIDAVKFDELGRQIATYTGQVDETLTSYLMLARLFAETPKSQTVYNALGQVEIEIDALGNSRTYTYDAFGRTTSVTLADPDGDGPLTAPVSRAYYDKYGRTTASVAPDGKVTSYEYDALGRQSATYLGVLASKSSGHYASGSFTFTDLPQGEEYDIYVSSVASTDLNIFGDAKFVKFGSATPVNGTLTIPTNADTLYIVRKMPTSQTIYDFNGRTIATVDATGNRTDYEYDNLGRKSRVIAPDPDGDGPLQRTITRYVYNNAGQLIEQVTHTPGLDIPGLPNIVSPSLLYGPRADDYRNSIIVTTLDDVSSPDMLTLREAIALAKTMPGYDTIEFDSSLSGVLKLSKGELSVDSDVTIIGLGVDKITLDAQGQSRIMNIASGVSVELVGMVFTGGYNKKEGGAISSIGANLTVSEMVFRDNEAKLGGAIYAEGGNILIDSSRITGNTTTHGGAGLYLYRNASVTIQLSTISGNTTEKDGGGIYIEDSKGPAVVSFCTIMENSAIDGGGIMAFKVTPGINNSVVKNNTVAKKNSAADITGTVKVTNDAPYQGDVSCAASGFTISTIQQYDEYGRVVKTTQRGADGLETFTIYSYDILGRQVSAGDALGNTTNFVYDGVGRKISETNAEGGTTSYAYDAAGRLASLTDPENNTTYYVYDTYGKVVSEAIMVDGELLERVFEYDAAGNMISKTDRNGRTVKYFYDNLLRLTSETWYNGDTVDKVYESRFDDLGRIVWIGEVNTHDAFDYNVFGQIVRQTQHIDGFTSVVTLDYKYDAAGRKTQTTASVGGVKKYETDYEHDRIGRTTSIIQDSKRVDYRYGQGGQLALLKRFDGGKSVVETTYDYDSLGRVKNIDHASADKVFADYDFTWDASGRITDFDIDSLVGVKGDSSYDYDKTGQLTGADHSNQNDETYQYDANGNRSNYETGDHNRLLSDGVYRYTYDAEGNRVPKTNIATGEKVEYTWDHRNRLTKVVFKNASGQEVKIVEYAYDYGQRLVRKTLDTNADGVIEKNSIFMYDNGQIAMEYEGNLLAHKYLWGSKVDELLATDSDWTLTDHLGSVRDVVSKDGVVKNHIVYDSFGNVTSQTGTTTPLFLYTGKLFDVDTKLQNNLNRWYDAKVGRWLSVDPIGFAGKDANLYRYVGNSTAAYFDPSGLATRTYGPYHFNPREFSNSFDTGFFVLHVDYSFKNFTATVKESDVCCRSKLPNTPTVSGYLYDIDISGVFEASASASVEWRKGVSIPNIVGAEVFASATLKATALVQANMNVHYVTCLNQVEANAKGQYTLTLAASGTAGAYLFIGSDRYGAQATVTGELILIGNFYVSASFSRNSGLSIAYGIGSLTPQPSLGITAEVSYTWETTTDNKTFSLKLIN